MTLLPVRRQSGQSVSERINEAMNAWNRKNAVNEEFVAFLFLCTRVSGGVCSFLMKVWQGIVISVFFHGALLCVPIEPESRKEEVKEDLQFVIVRVEAQSEKNALSQGQPPADLPDGEEAVEETVSKPMFSEPPPDLDPWEDIQPEEEVPDEPEPVEEPEPIKKVVLPPKPVDKPKPPEIKPPPKKKPEKPVKTAVRPKPPKTPEPDTTPIQTAEKVVSQARSSESTGSRPASIGEPRQTAGPSSAVQGPVEAQFGASDGPSFTRRVTPKYPRLARETGKEGTVLLLLSIDERGRLTHVEVLKGAGSALDAEAVKAVKASSFAPARKNGRPVACKARLPIRFVLRSS